MFDALNTLSSTDQPDKAVPAAAGPAAVPGDLRQAGAEPLASWCGGVEAGVARGAPLPREGAKVRKKRKLAEASAAEASQAAERVQWASAPAQRQVFRWVLSATSSRDRIWSIACGLHMSVVSEHELQLTRSICVQRRVDGIPDDATSRAHLQARAPSAHLRCHPAHDQPRAAGRLSHTRHRPPRPRRHPCAAWPLCARDSAWLRVPAVLQAPLQPALAAGVQALFWVKHSPTLTLAQSYETLLHYVSLHPH